MPSLLRDRSFRALTISQFLGALNDNAFKQFVLLAAALGGFADWSGGAWAQAHGQALGQALFALPFLVFAPLAGLLADRVSKRRVIVGANLLEVVVMVVAGLALTTRSTALLFASVALMGTQSAFFGPSKYGAIPELVPPHRIARANGLIQTSTFLAILAGLILGGLGADAWLAERFDPRLGFVAIALAGALVSLRIRALKPAGDATPGSWNPVSSVRAGWTLVRADRPLGLAIGAGGLFWLVGSALVLVLNAWGAAHGLGGADIASHLAALALGIAAGSFLAGRACGDRIELGLVPFGLYTMAAALAFVALGPPATPRAWGGLAVAGIAAGLYSVPLRALIQARSPRERRGSVLGLSEFADFTGIFAASFLFAGLELAGATPAAMLVALAMGLVAFAALALRAIGDASVRFVLRVFLHLACRLRVRGAERVPASGGALLVANHVSYVDAFLVAVAARRRVRFLMHRSFFDLPILGRWAHALGVLPVASGDGSSTTGQTLRVAAEAAAAGELVCIFAEGSITRSGSLLGFRRGLETIARRAGVPIVPVAIHGPGLRAFGLRPEPGRQRGLRLDVRIAFGDPLASDTSAWDVRQAVAALGYELASAARDQGPSLAWRFVRSARRHAGRTAVVDAEGAWTYRRLLVSACALARTFERELRGEARVGVLLPPGRGAALASAALALDGRSAVQLNYLLSNEDLAQQLERTGARTVITSRRFLRALERSAPEPPDGSVLCLEDLQVPLRDRVLALLVSCLPGPWAARIAARRAAAADELCVLFSSGSTAEPKGVRLSQGNVLANVDAFARMTSAGPDDAVLGVLPSFHAFGLTGTLWMPLVAGARAIYHPNPLDARTVGRLAREHRATLLLGAPSFFAAWLRRFEPADVEHVRLAIVGAERLEPRLAAAWQRRFGQPLYEGYGCTELAPAVAFSLPDHVSSATKQTGSKPRSVGRALPGIALRVVDPDTGRELPPEDEGLVLVASPGRMLGYLDDERTRAALRAGWYVTGDVGRLDREGFLTLTDRLSRFAKIGGEMVPFGRVEEELVSAFARAFPGLEPPELAVTSIRDERRGERLRVLYADDGSGAVDVERWRRAIGPRLPALFQPRARDFVRVDELPRLPSGKLDLRRLRGLAEPASAA